MNARTGLIRSRLERFSQEEKGQPAITARAAYLQDVEYLLTALASEEGEADRLARERDGLQRQLDALEIVPAGGNIRAAGPKRGTPARADIYAAIDRERAYQDRKYPHGHAHEVAGFLLIMEGELREAVQGWLTGRGDRDALREILQVVSVGVACLEAHGVIERAAQVAPEQGGGR